MTNDVTPIPAMIIESLRDFGYTLETAIADIVDNSITANATEINVRFSWNNGSPWVAIADNGAGMTESILINAMRFGCKNPTDDRPQQDLGRFGMGLKTASLSQCRCFTVITKTKTTLTVKQWDIDWVKETNKWQVKSLELTEINQFSSLHSAYITYLSKQETGTIVFWDKMDRLKSGESYFNALINEAREHIELVFHRFLDDKKSPIAISFNGRHLEAWDPFFVEKARPLSEETVHCGPNQEKVVIQPYILPHHSRATDAEYKKFSGRDGYLNSQGFYVYRCKRLIIRGTWFKLFSRSPLTQLARVQIDISNNLDHLWKIDVRKSSATPPEEVRLVLRQVIGKIIAAAERPYTHVNHPVKDPTKCSVWCRSALGSIKYVINRDHPIIKGATTSKMKDFNGEEILKLIESTFPIDLFFHDYATSPHTSDIRADIDEKIIDEILKSFLSSFQIQGNNLTKKQFDYLLSIEPFCLQKDYVSNLLKTGGFYNE
jgi:hypothetical protein